MQSKHYCIICKKIPSLTKTNADFPNSEGTGTIPKMMEKSGFP